MAALHSNEPGEAEKSRRRVGRLVPRTAGQEQASETGAETYISTEDKRCKRRLRGVLSLQAYLCLFRSYEAIGTAGGRRAHNFAIEHSSKAALESWEYPNGEERHLS